MSAQKLTTSQLEDHLARLDGWIVKDGKLHRELQFDHFQQAFAFMTRLALYAEAQQHHPEWFNVWNRVVIDLTTHDVGGLSDKDVAFAEAVNAALD
ncbi:MAG: 4a-hydroxytetrahydrobiopterin dehydratase [Thermoanaerobaculia bacterium]|nr:4a-hydroxytetrahydrobiopterin dehydratase [Thermoanaerobaculia bacterium]